MSATTLPTIIEPIKWAEQGYAWSGQLPLARFERITQEAIVSDDSQLVQVTCRLEMDRYHRFVWLDAQLETQVTLQCQRCLEPVTLPLKTEVHVAILSEESQLDWLEDDIDFILLGEDLGTEAATAKTAATLNLIYILEDELLLSLPPAPKHVDCHSTYLTSLEEEPQPNPFGALAALKGKI